MNIITFNNVKKEYKNKKEICLAVDHISFDISEGEIIGLVGPNGAGKSTIVKLLCGILTPSSGSISILNLDPSKNRKKLSYHIGVMFGNRSSLWYNIPAIESVLLMKDIYNINNTIYSERLEKYSNILKISDILNKPVRQMSLGQKIRTEILVTILHNPKILILDEPTLGLDIVSKLQFREMLMQLAKESKTSVILTTHDMNDVEKICHRVLLINKGQKLIDMTSNEFQLILEEYEVIYIENNGEFDWSSEEFFREKTDQWHKFFVPKESKKQFMTHILAKDEYALQIKTERSSLEDILYEYYN